MGMLQRFRNRKIQGAELVVTGGIAMFFSSIIAFLAPLSLIGYGLYRWLFKKNYRQGITIMAGGIIFLLLLKFPLHALTKLPLIAGAAILAYGVFLMVLPSRPSEEIEEVSKIEETNGV